jgi:hypothetical protein
MNFRGLDLAFFAGLALVGCVGDTASNSPADSSTPDDAHAADSSIVDAADVSQPWTPAVLDGQGQLALWLESSSANITISNGKVGVWKDLSKNHNDALNSQGGPTVDSAVVANHDAVHFVNATLTVTDVSSVRFGIDQVVVAAVVKANTTTNYWYSKTKAASINGPYASGLEIGASTSTIKVDGGPVSSNSPFAHIAATSGNLLSWGDPVFDAKFHLVALRRKSGTSLEMSVDGSAPRNVTTSAINIDQANVPITIGNVTYNNVAQNFDFQLTEMVVVHGSSGVVADVDVANLQTYLKQKYAL